MFWKLRPVSNRTAVALIKAGEFFKSLMFIVSVVTVLYQTKGVSIGDFFLIQGLFRFAMFLMEIPSGYMADRFSRKKVLFCGTFLSFLAFVELYFAFNFWTVLISELMMGFAGALFSGTLEAYAYDLLKRDNKEKNFLKEYGSINTYAILGDFIGAIIGSALYDVIGNGIVALQAASIGISVICVSLLPELTEVKRKVSKNISAFKDIAGIVKMTIKHPELKWLMIFPSLFGAFTIVLMWGLQPLMQTVGVSLVLFGFFGGLNKFGRLIYAKSAHRVYEILGLRKFMGLIMGILAIGIMSCIIALNLKTMWLIYVLCFIVTLAAAIHVWAYLVFNTLIHHRIKSTERGTVLSVKAMYSTFLGGSLLMLMKPLMDGMGLESAMIILLLLLPVMFIVVYKILKMNIK